jgi:hypothetical protein
VIADEALLRTVLETLERMPCEFWACEGPTLNPIDMVTCRACHTLALVSNRLGIWQGEPARAPAHPR